MAAYVGCPFDTGARTRKAPTPQDILREAKRIIRFPWRWTRYEHARNWWGAIVDPEDTSDCRFCGYGALVRAARNLGATDKTVLEVYEQHVPDIDEINDGPNGYFAVRQYLLSAIINCV